MANHLLTAQWRFPGLLAASKGQPLWQHPHRWDRPVMQGLLAVAVIVGLAGLLVQWWPVDPVPLPVQQQQQLASQLQGLPSTTRSAFLIKGALLKTSQYPLALPRSRLTDALHRLSEPTLTQPAACQPDALVSWQTPADAPAYWLIKLACNPAAQRLQQLFPTQEAPVWFKQPLWRHAQWQGWHLYQAVSVPGHLWLSTRALTTTQLAHWSPTEAHPLQAPLQAQALAHRQAAFMGQVSLIPARQQAPVWLKSLPPLAVRYKPHQADTLTLTWPVPPPNASVATTVVMEAPPSAGEVVARWQDGQALAQWAYQQLFSPLAHQLTETGLQVLHRGSATGPLAEELLALLRGPGQFRLRPASALAARPAHWVLSTPQTADKQAQLQQLARWQVPFASTPVLQRVGAAPQWEIRLAGLPFVSLPVALHLQQQGRQLQLCSSLPCQAAAPKAGPSPAEALPLLKGVAPASFWQAQVAAPLAEKTGLAFPVSLGEGEQGTIHLRMARHGEATQFTLSREVLRP